MRPVSACVVRGRLSNRVDPVSQHVPARAVITVQLSLDRLEHFRHPLVLIDADRPITTDKVGR